MITEDYVSFEIAKLLKDKGFKVPSFNPAEWIFCMYDEQGKLHWGAYSDDWYCRVTIQMTMKWLREEKGIAVIPVLSSVLDNEKFLWDIKIVVAETNDTYSQGWVYEKQEDACEAAIKCCLENLI